MVDHTPLEVDPVCGMTLKPDQVAATSEYDGEVYHFCSSDCKQLFDTRPEDYV